MSITEISPYKTSGNKAGPDVGKNDKGAQTAVSIPSSKMIYTIVYALVFHFLHPHKYFTKIEFKIRSTARLLVSAYRHKIPKLHVWSLCIIESLLVETIGKYPHFILS